MSKKPMKCYRRECRYNSGERCICESKYDECITVVAQVLGSKRYEEFCRWEKEHEGQGEM